MNIDDAEKVLRELIELVDGTLTQWRCLTSAYTADEKRRRIIYAWENIGLKFSSDIEWSKKCSDAIDMLFASMHLKIVGYTTRSTSKLTTNIRTISYYPKALAVKLEDRNKIVQCFTMPAQGYFEWDLLTSKLIQAAMTSEFAARAGAALHLMRIAEVGEYFSLRELLETDVPWVEMSWEDDNSEQCTGKYNYWYVRARERCVGRVKDKLFDVQTECFYTSVNTSRIVQHKSMKEDKFYVYLVPDLRFGKTTFIV